MVMEDWLCAEKACGGLSLVFREGCKRVESRRGVYRGRWHGGNY